MRITKAIVVSIFVVLMQFGCSDKQNELYNKPALFWYKLIIKDVRDLDLEKADNHYVSMSSEHVGSPLLAPTLLILAQAHMDSEEYILANFYLDNYIKRYGTTSKNEYARYMKIKANYLSFSHPNRNQELLLQTIKDTAKYIDMYPNSIYRPMVETMLVRMELGEYYLNKNIKKLYERIDHDNSAKVYEEMLKSSSLKESKMIEPDIPWYRILF